MVGDAPNGTDGRPLWLPSPAMIGVFIGFLAQTVLLVSWLVNMAADVAHLKTTVADQATHVRQLGDVSNRLQVVELRQRDAIERIDKFDAAIDSLASRPISTLLSRVDAAEKQLERLDQTGGRAGGQTSERLGAIERRSDEVQIRLNRLIEMMIRAGPRLPFDRVPPPDQP